MKFKFGVRARSGQYTVRPTHAIMDPVTKRVENTKPLRVHFKEHSWDSEVAQREFQWSDAERLECEEYLKNHPDFGRVDGRGIFIDQTAKQLPKEQLEAIYAQRDVNAMKQALSGAPPSGHIGQMVHSLLEQAEALLKMQGVSVPEELVIAAETTEDPKERVCINMREAGEHVIQCTNPAEFASDFCEACAREIAEAEEANKPKAATAAKPPAQTATVKEEVKA